MEKTTFQIKLDDIKTMKDDIEEIIKSIKDIDDKIYVKHTLNIPRKIFKNLCNITLNIKESEDFFDTYDDICKIYKKYIIIFYNIIITMKEEL
jgi:hypothetical protein